MAVCKDCGQPTGGSYVRCRACHQAWVAGEPPQTERRAAASQEQDRARMADLSRRVYRLEQIAQRVSPEAWLATDPQAEADREAEAR